MNSALRLIGRDHHLFEEELRRHSGELAAAVAGKSFLVIGGAGLILSPLTAWISRSFERASDRYAMHLTRNPNAFVSSMKKLADLNLAETDPPPWIEFLFHGHPSISRRIRFAERFSVPEEDLRGA